MSSRGNLWCAARARARAALASGALQPIATELRWIDDAGVRFMVRIGSSRARRPEVRRPGSTRAAPAPDPFLPFDGALYVAPVTPKYIALLNKFPVVESHLLFVSRGFEHQELLLAPEDFAAAAVGLRDVDGLVFYNGGAVAGASQAHRHLQLIALPTTGAPTEALFDAVRGASSPCAIPAFQFRHAFGWLDDDALAEPARAGPRLDAVYRALLAGAGVRAVPDRRGPWQSAPYNVLLTRRWMLIVPRRRECFDGASINALAFAGSLFVRGEDEFARLRAAGPLAVLHSVAVPPPGAAPT